MKKRKQPGKPERRKRCACVLAAVLLSALLSGCGSTAGSDAVSDALLKIGDRDFEGAVTSLNEAEAGGEDSRALYRALGIALMGTGDYEGASGALEKALEKSSGIPDDFDIDVNYYLATCFIKLNDENEAKDIYDSIIAYRPGEVLAYRLRATVEADLQDPDSADADFRKAIELAPGDYDAVISAYVTMSDRGYTDQAEAYLSEALAGSSAISNYDKGRLYYYQGDYDDAKTCLESALSEENGSFRTTLLLGQTYEALGSTDYAADTYEKYLQNDQTHAEIYNQLGLCRLTLGDAQAALDAFQSGEKIADGSVLQSLKYNEITAYEKLGNFSQANILIQSYLKLYPEDSDAKREAVFLATR